MLVTIKNEMLYNIPLKSIMFKLAFANTILFLNYFSI